MSIENNPGPEFLKQKYDLHNSPEVESAAKRADSEPRDANSRIQNYLDRLESIINPPKLEGHENFDRRERNINMLKSAMHNQFVVKPEEIPEGYFENQQRLARELGHGDIEITDEMRAQNAEIIIADQTSSLDNWVDYLSGDDAPYPDWLKYFAIRSVTTMGGYDKEKHAFSKRSKGTTKPFPDLNREALAHVLDAMEKKYEGRSIESLEGDEKIQFEKLLSSENFAKLYAWATEKVTPASVEQITITDGKWVKYPKGTDPTTFIPEGFDRALVPSLHGHGTGWCTTGESTACTQLKAGDFYVFYSLDENGKPIIPRAAIRMQGDHIGEVRGIAPEQNLDPYINDVVKNKLEEFPDGKAYEKKVDDMRYLTGIERKVKAGQELYKNELIFLYEINSQIEGFGYQRDPRIAELRSQRDPRVDAPIVFECQPNEIAWSQEQINKNTKAYVGPLFSGIFNRLSNIEHIYTAFPEGKISRSELEIGGKSKEELEIELLKVGKISDYAKDMLHSPDFTTLENSEQIDLVRLKVSGLGFPNGATTDQIYSRAEELGLELCPAEVGPHQRLKDLDQSLGDWYNIAMKQIYLPVRDGYLDVFFLARNEVGLWLRSHWALPDYRWHADRELVFRLPQVSSES